MFKTKLSDLLFVVKKLWQILSFLLQVLKPKSKLIKGDPAGEDKLEMLACDRKSQSGNKN